MIPYFVIVCLFASLGIVMHIAITQKGKIEQLQFWCDELQDENDKLKKMRKINTSGIPAPDLDKLLS